MELTFEAYSDVVIGPVVVAGNRVRVDRLIYFGLPQNLFKVYQGVSKNG